MKQPKNIWRIRLRPHDKHKNEFGFCYQRGIIGIGWQVFDAPSGQQLEEVDEYLEQVKSKYKKDIGGKKASEAISTVMCVDDLVWTRNQDDRRRYLGQIKEPWEYRDDDEHRAADIVSVCRCPLHEVRTADVGENPESFFVVIDKHLNLPITLQRIVKDQKLKDRTKEIWEKIQSEI